MHIMIILDIDKANLYHGPINIKDEENQFKVKNNTHSSPANAWENFLCTALRIVAG